MIQNGFRMAGMKRWTAMALLLSTFGSGALTIATGEVALAYSVTQVTTDPGRTLRHDYSLSPGIEVGSVTSCMIRSGPSGRKDLCRVIDGYETIDNRNWKIDFATNESPLSVAGVNNSTYGMVIVLGNGAIYEGCNWISPANDYICDYRARKEKVMLVSGTNAYVLRKTWDWIKYVGTATSCAGGITSAWTGNPITLGALTACADGPL